MKSLGNILDKKIFLNSFVTKELKKNNENNNKENKDCSNQKDNNSKDKNIHVNFLSTNEKKFLYKNYIEKNKNNRNSYDPSNRNKINKKVNNNNLSINSNGISQRKIHNLKNPSLDKKNILNFEKGSLSEMQNKIKFERIGSENNKLKSREKFIEKGNNIIKKINYNHIDINTKKMKFIKK
jgi:hypothetical protein